MKKSFSYWLGSRFFSNFGKQLQATAIAWQIFQLTRDPLALGMLGLVEAVPFVGIALWAGHLVDRHEKRSFMIRSEVGLFLSSCALLAGTLMDHPPVWFFYLITAFTGLCTSFENVSTSAYGQLLIPKHEFPKAMGWNLGLFQAALITGPIAGGWLLLHFSARALYGVAGVFILISLVLAVRLHPIHVPPPTGETESGLERVKHGLRFIWSQPMILAAMSLDMVAVLFGDVVALYPFFADRLNAGSIGFGFLKAAPGFGSATISAIQAARPFVRPTWRALRIVVFVFGLCMIAFALSPNIFLAVFFLALGGAADGVSVIIRQSIYQASTPDHLRGRVSSVSSIFISTSNEVGAFESGLAAKFLGIVPSVLIGGTITLLSVGVMTRVFRERFRSKINA